MKQLVNNFNGMLTVNSVISMQRDLSRSAVGQWSEAFAGISNNKTLFVFDNLYEKQATIVQND